MVRAFLFLIPILPVIHLIGQSIDEPSGVSIKVDSIGDFSINAGEPGWSYGGKIQGIVTEIIGPARGSDSNAVSTNGPFDELTVYYLDLAGGEWRMQIRAYRNIPSATLSFSPQHAVSNIQPYAVLTQFPIAPHHFSLGGWTRAFGPLSAMHADSPWVFFSDQFRASILSPASRPISQRQRWVDDETQNGAIALEVDASNPILRAADVYTSVITFDQGIGNAFDRWGLTLTNLLGKRRPGNQADLSLVKPMLSTDAGATYYYVFDPALGYEGTLRAAISSAKAAGIPIGVVHFDSWWQLKGGNCDAVENSAFASWKNHLNGAWKYVMDPALFLPINSENLEDGFVQNLGPGMAHARWVDTCSPYRLPIRDVTGNVTVPHPVSGNVVTDLGIWRRVAHTLSQSGMILFEPDFLTDIATAANTFEDEQSLGAMAIAMAEKGINLQYCGPATRHFLLAFRYEMVHTIRVSIDRFDRSKWDQEMYGSMILKAGGVWPAVDNFLTTEKRNLLLAVLSAGPLALGDPIGRFVPIPEAIRADGVILKPDMPMVPTDASFVAEAAAIERSGSIGAETASLHPVLPPLVGHTYSDFGSSRMEYVFAYSRDQNMAMPVGFAPQELGFTGDVYVYDYFNRTGQRQAAAQRLEIPVDSQGSYFVVAPVGASQIAFLGDLSKFVPASRLRMPSFSDTGAITLTLQLKLGEKISLWLSAASAPSVSADHAAVSEPRLDSSTGLYEFAVSRGEGEQATIRIAPKPAP
jgi:hypothetical protein